MLEDEEIDGIAEIGEVIQAIEASNAGRESTLSDLIAK